MKVSREQMAENRKRILSVASRLFREKGFESVSVAEVMKGAGLTHGGFYGHFSSKDELIAQSLAHAYEPAEDDSLDFDAFLDRYLSTQHRDHPAKGCPTAGLAAETRHQGAAARAAIAEGLRAQIVRISESLPCGTAEERRRAAIGTWSAMVGAVILARSVDEPALSEEVLAQTRAWIKAGRPSQPDFR